MEVVGGGSHEKSIWGTWLSCSLYSAFASRSQLKQAKLIATVGEEVCLMTSPHLFVVCVSFEQAAEEINHAWNGSRHRGCNRFHQTKY